MMKKRIVAIGVLGFILQSSSVFAQLHVIGPQTARQSDWTVVLDVKKDMVSFTVSNTQWDTNSIGKVEAKLSVVKEHKVLSSAILGLVRDDGRPCLKFTIARNLLKESTLVVLPAKRTRGAVYQVELHAFLVAHEKKEVPQPPPTGDSLKAAPEE